MRGWADPEGLKRNQLPMRGTSNPLLWSSFTVLPQGNQLQGQISIFHSVNEWHTLNQVRFGPHCTCSQQHSVVLTIALSSEHCIFSMIVSWFSPTSLGVSPLTPLHSQSSSGQAQSFSLLFILCFPLEHLMHTHVRPQLQQILHMTHKFASITQTFPLSF